MWRKYFLEEAPEEQTMQSHTQWKPWITSVSSYKLHKQLWQHFTSPRTFLFGGIVTLEKERIFLIQHQKNTMKTSPGPLFLIHREHLPLCIHVKLLRQCPIISVHQSLQVKKATHHCLGKCFHSLQRVSRCNVAQQLHRKLLSRCMLSHPGMKIPESFLHHTVAFLLGEIQSDFFSLRPNVPPTENATSRWTEKEIINHRTNH